MCQWNDADVFKGHSCLGTRVYDAGTVHVVYKLAIGIYFCKHWRRLTYFSVTREIFYHIEHISDTYEKEEKHISASW